MSSLLAPASKTEQLSEEGAGACLARPATDDAEMRWVAGADGGGRLTLGQLVDSVWEGLLAVGVAGCPACGGRMERAGSAGRCRDCGASIS